MVDVVSSSQDVDMERPYDAAIARAVSTSMTSTKMEEFSAPKRTSLWNCQQVSSGPPHYHLKLGYAVLGYVGGVLEILLMNTAGQKRTKLPPKHAWKDSLLAAKVSPEM